MGTAVTAVPHPRCCQHTQLHPGRHHVPSAELSLQLGSDPCLDFGMNPIFPFKQVLLGRMLSASTSLVGGMGGVSGPGRADGINSLPITPGWAEKTELWEKFSNSPNRSPAWSRGPGLLWGFVEREEGRRDLGKNFQPLK